MTLPLTFFCVRVFACRQDMKGVTFTPELVAERGRSRSPKGRRRRRGWEEQDKGGGAEEEADKQAQVRGRDGGQTWEGG